MGKYSDTPASATEWNSAQDSVPDHNLQDSVSCIPLLKDTGNQGMESA